MCLVPVIAELARGDKGRQAALLVGAATPQKLVLLLICLYQPVVVHRYYDYC
jgi:hypothetical protein